jgi:4'-phosphopantetheinyl transferase
MAILYITRVSSNDSELKYRSLLSPDIIDENTSKISNPNYLHAHLTALSLLTLAVREYMKVGEFKLHKLNKTDNGKPYLDGDKYPKFNWSHTGNIILLGISNTEIGVDIEQVKERNVLPIAKRFFSNREYQYIMNNTDAKARFFEMWVMRESIGKYLGDGIQSFASIEIDPYNEKIFHKNKVLPCRVWSGTYQNFKIAAVTKDEQIKIKKIDCNKYTSEELETDKILTLYQSI